MRFPILFAVTAAAASVVTAEPAPLALFPVANLAGPEAPVEEIESAFRAALFDAGVPLLDADAIEAFAVRHRIRYTAGLTRTVAPALREDTGAPAAILTSIELWDPRDPPRIALSSRLVSAEREPRILWIDAVALAGDDRHGIFGLRLVQEPEVLLAEASRRLAASLAAHLSGAPPEEADRVARRYRPRRAFLAVERPGERLPRPRIAVVPLTDLTGKVRAGEIVALRLVRELARRPDLDVVEPGVVRQALLDTRTIPARGVSLPQADLLRQFLRADLVVSGNVFVFSDGIHGVVAPEVEFSAVALDTAKRTVAWTLFSGAAGDDGVQLFERGRVRTGSGLTTLLARGVVVEVFGRRARDVYPERSAGPNRP